MQKDGVRVRRAETRDADQIAVVHEASWRNAYQGLLPHADLLRIVHARDARHWRRVILLEDRLYVLDYRGTAVGYASVGPCSRRSPARSGTHGRFGEIFELYLHPVFQGIGFGARLFDVARQRFADDGYAGFFVRALADNASARHFYERRGGRVAFRDSEAFSGRTMETISYFWLLRG